MEQETKEPEIPTEAQYCSACKRQINFESEEVMHAKDGRFWCNQWCATRPVKREAA